MMDVKDEMEDL
jgi:hypothetical protein